MGTPEIVTPEEIAKFLKIGVKTVFNYTSSKLWVDGIYIIRGKYNLSRLKDAISKPPYRYLKKVSDKNIYFGIKI